MKPNLFVIDSFYTNPDETREFILKQDFKVRGNYPGQRTISYANEDMKNDIQKVIEPLCGKITYWKSGNESDNYNGSFQYTTSRDRSWVHTDHGTDWAGVLFLTPNAPLSGGTGIYMYEDGTRFEKEARERKINKLVNDHSQDMTKWKLVDRIGNVYNRLVLFNSKQFHTSMDYFGNSKEDGRLFQVFFFNTEK